MRGGGRVALGSSRREAVWGGTAALPVGPSGVSW